MLAYVHSTGRGDDDLLAEVAQALQAQGMRLAGAVQRNSADGTECCSRMELVLLTGRTTDPSPIGISQRLGGGATGCRLDPDGLERAVGRIAAMIAAEGAAIDIVVVNKFGRQEAEGGGFRPVIAQALSAGVPVLTKLSPDAAPAFAEFAGDLAEELPPERSALIDWCRAMSGAADWR